MTACGDNRALCLENREKAVRVREMQMLLQKAMIQGSVRKKLKKGAAGLLKALSGGLCRLIPALAQMQGDGLRGQFPAFGQQTPHHPTQPAARPVYLLETQALDQDTEALVEQTFHSSELQTVHGSRH
jgi:hypothetical protein